ncbi:hypothetical protein AVEN_76496-1 [Araneus ventricosus]|uniref:Uncharacterized protein n=1 Tax=Araneus ventricosus TaxID=182803 RepID=A0A4Y2CF10_ARAVE|nr:hypothetical protein AVEN_76496-1 [Araneus ventricosus]
MANPEDLQEDEYGPLREEFHQLIVPLIRKCWHDKPTDVALYCARYFQALVEERQRSSISGYENENIRQGACAETRGKAEKGEPVPQVQESTSLPILTNVHRDRLSLRETSSWSSPSDSSSMPRRLWDASYDVADAMSRIGDQPKKNVAKEDALDAENCSVKGSYNQLFVGDQGSKDREKDLGYHERNNDSGILKPSKRSVIDEGIASPIDSEVEEELSSIVIASPVDNEIEEELSAIVNSASSSTDVTPGTTYRKKWCSNIDSYLDLTLKSEFAEATDGEEEFGPDSNSDQCSPKDDTAESLAVSRGCTSPNVPLVSDPQSEELEISETTKQSSAPFIQREIEDSVKLINQSFQDLVKVLDSMKFFCNENLQRAKTLSEALPEKPLRAPRKQRSVTTFSSSDNLFQSNGFSSGPGNKPTATAADEVCAKTSQKLLELKSNDSGVESDSFGSGYPLKGKKVEEEFAKHKKIAPTEEANAGTSNNLGSKQGSFLEKNGRNINENRVDSKDTCMNGKSRCREGIVNKGFVIDDSELHMRSHRLGHHGQNWWHANGYRRSMFNEQSPFSQIRIPRPSSGRNVNLTRHHNQTPRQMPTFRFSYIGEGGDIFSTSRSQCSVATETEAMQATGTFDARIREMRIHPVADGNTEQEARSSEQVNGESGSQVSEGELQDLTSSLSEEQSSKLSEENPVETGSAAEGTPAGMDEKVEAQESRVEIKPSKKSSSLNPCAECFNPPSKLVQNLEVLKSPDENDTPNLEQRSFDFAVLPVELSIKSFPEVDADWDYEMFLEDFLLEDQEPILYQNVDSDGHIVSLTIEEVEDQHKFENEVCAAERDLLGPASLSYEENRLMKGRDGTPLCEKREDCKKHNRQSDLKLAEGDQGLEAAEDGAERSDSAEKREEPGLSSACGDFVAAENNNEGVENSGDEAENAQAAVAPGAIAFDMGIPGFLPLNMDDNASATQSRREEEEMELNFACFSGSDSSEVDSSDISEEEGEFSGENDENKLEEKA